MKTTLNRTDTIRNDLEDAYGEVAQWARENGCIYGVDIPTLRLEWPEMHARIQALKAEGRLLWRAGL